MRRRVPDLLPCAVDRDERLELVEESEHRIATGFVGTPIVSDALTSTGHVDAAYDLLLEHEAPSWLYAVRQGATTVWERWDSLRPDGTVNPGTMTSFNHYALGAVAGWLHRVVAGLAPAAPGYREIPFRAPSRRRADLGVGGAPDAVRARGDRVDPGR